MSFHIAKPNSSTGCSAPQSRFRRWRRRMSSATTTFKWSFRCSPTARESSLSMLNLRCVANEFSRLRSIAISLAWAAVDVDVQSIIGFLLPLLPHPTKRARNGSQIRLLSYKVRKLECLDVKYMKVTRKLMPKYILSS